MSDHAIFTASTADSITVFFDPPESKKPGETYTLHVNGQFHSKTDKTHATIENLDSDREYAIDVLFRNEIVYSAQERTSPVRKRIDIQDFGALGDGKTLNTHAIQEAIDACGKDEEVYVPSGIFQTGAVRLHSDMSLYLEEGAVLLGTENPEDYLPRIPSRFEGTEMLCYSSLINIGEMDHTRGCTTENILIHGKGTIESGGQTLAMNIISSEKDRLKEYLLSHPELVSSCENENTIPGRVRPRLVNISNCRNVRICGLTLKNGASWNVHMIYSEDIITDHCTFVSEGVWNGDGWDPDSSRNCSIFACTFHTGDDCVAIKSGKNPEGNRINIPCTDIRVFDCVCKKGHGIAIGSEISGGIERVRIYDCDLNNSFCGILIKGTEKRGGYVRDILVRDTSAPCILVRSVPFNDDGIPAQTPPIFRDFRFERLRLSGDTTSYYGEKGAFSVIELNGFEKEGYELSNVTVKDCRIGTHSSLILSHCRDIRLSDLQRTDSSDF